MLLFCFIGVLVLFVFFVGLGSRRRGTGGGSILKFNGPQSREIPSKPVTVDTTQSAGSSGPHNVVSGRYVPPSEDPGSGGSKSTSEPTHYDWNN